MKSRIEIALRVLRSGLMIIVPVFMVFFSPLLLGDAESKRFYFGLIGLAVASSFLIAGVAFIDKKE